MYPIISTTFRCQLDITTSSMCGSVGDYFYPSIASFLTSNHIQTIRYDYSICYISGNLFCCYNYCHYHSNYKCERVCAAQYKLIVRVFVSMGAALEPFKSNRSSIKISWKDIRGKQVAMGVPQVLIGSLWFSTFRDTMTVHCGMCFCLWASLHTVS